MKEILFKPDLIQAIAEGRKTVTRRLDGLKNVNGNPAFIEVTDTGLLVWDFHYKFTDVHYTIKPRLLPGEVVYIKEAWATEEQYDNLKPSGLPDNAYIHFVSTGIGDYPLDIHLGKFRSPRFLPEKFARYFIKIKDVRPERLQGITEEKDNSDNVVFNQIGWCKEGISSYLSNMQRESEFTHLWDSINKKTPWSSNPWVWRIEFELVK